MKHKRIATEGMRIISIILMGIATYACSPSIEDVTYTEYSAHLKNNLSITVNTHRGLFRGRESFLHFKRDIYLITFDTGGRNHNEKDIEIVTVQELGIEIKPKQACIDILDDQPGGILVEIAINDERIPKKINGKYRLQTSSKGVPISHEDMIVKSDWYKLR